MKHLVWRLESQSFFGPVIQSVFDHSQLFVGALEKSLFGTIVTLASTTTEFAADGAAVSAQ